MEYLDQLWPILIDGAEYIGPALIALITVPIFGWIKKGAKWIDGLGAPLQRVMVLALTGLLTWLGSVIDAAIPAELALFQEADVSVALSTGYAMLIHSLRKRAAGGGG